MGAFFEVPAAEAQSWQESKPEWMSPPDDVLPVVVGVGRVIARSERAVVALTTLRPYPAGVLLGLAVWVRGDQEDEDWTGMPRGLFPGHKVTEHTLRLGAEFADGRRASNLIRPQCSDDEAPSDPVLGFHGGVGGAGPHGRVEIELWLWPLPPPGRLRVVCEWPAYGIAETSVELDAAELVEAAAQARRVWDD